MGKWLGIIVAFLMVLPGCGTETPTRFNTFTPLTSIVITSAVVDLPSGVSTQLTATGNFSGLFTRDITNQVEWSSAQQLTADFPPDLPFGRIQAFVPGTAIVTAVLDGVVSDGIILTVNDAVITALTVAPLLPSLPLGLSQAFTAQGVFTGGITLDLSKDVTWFSSNEAVATVSDLFASKGEATALQIGSTEISALFDIGPTATASTTLTVTAATLSTIAVTPSNPSILSLSTQVFSAQGTYSDKTTRDITTEVSWESTAPTVATLATGNIVKALTPGVSTIKATLGTRIGTSNLRVTGGSLQSIALTLAQANNNVLIRDTVSRVTARGTFSNNASRDITEAVVLTDNSVNVNVTPDSGGLAWVQATGVTPAGDPAKIFATYDSTVTTGEILLTVTEPLLSSIAISPTNLTLANATSGRLSLTGIFSSSNQDLTPTAAWTSANPAIAAVDNDGLEKGRVHALSPGTVDITSTYGGQTVTTSVTVVARTLQSLTISAVTTPSAILAGTEKKFKVEALYTDGVRQDVTENVAWSINDSNVARFSDQFDPGLVVAVDAGVAILTAKIGNISDTETLTVSQ